MEIMLAMPPSRVSRATHGTHVRPPRRTDTVMTIFPDISSLIRNRSSSCSYRGTSTSMGPVWFTGRVSRSLRMISGIVARSFGLLGS